MISRRLTAIATCACAVASARAAGAQEIKDNHFALDLFTGPVLAPISVTGIAGAYAGYAEGIAGFVANAASPAVREPFSMGWFDFDLSASVSIPVKLFENDDFDNSGTIDYDYSSFFYATVGGQLQLGPAGIGVNAELQRYSLTDQNGQTTHVTVGKYHALGALGFFGHQLMIGGGARLATLGLSTPDAVLTMFGAAPEVGFLVRPDWQSFRFGGTFRAPVDAGKFFGAFPVDAQGVERAGSLIVPERVVLPWEIEVGMAVQVGPRPLNPDWIDPHDQEREYKLAAEERRASQIARHGDKPASDPSWEKARKQLKQERRARYENWPREHLLLTAELLVTGSTDKGVGLERFLGQNLGTMAKAGSAVGTSGASTSYSPRFGIETEPVPGYVHTRLGSYFEPSRFDKIGRQHFTFGADLKLFPTTYWGLVDQLTYKLQASVDLSPRYQSFSLGAGVWH